MSPAARCAIDFSLEITAGYVCKRLPLAQTSADERRFHADLMPQFQKRPLGLQDHVLPKQGGAEPLVETSHGAYCCISHRERSVCRYEKR
jgi:hypothetical protein